jgi:hypothetical protein
MSTQDIYQSRTKLDQNTWITPPEVPDPDNLPQPLGWTLQVRPYSIGANEKKTSLILTTERQGLDYMNHVINIGRVVAIGPCCWTRSEHRMKDGTQTDWVQVGDFVSFPKNTGSRVKFKGVSYITLVDDEVVQLLRDPQVFDDEEGYFKLNIPQADLEKYNTIHNKEFK